eukprot:SAG31_NODE_25_length_33055_cov_11.407919_17_plen_100_part_00
MQFENECPNQKIVKGFEWVAEGIILDSNQGRVDRARIRLSLTIKTIFGVLNDGYILANFRLFWVVGARISPWLPTAIRTSKLIGHEIHGQRTMQSKLQQ